MSVELTQSQRWFIKPFIIRPVIKAFVFANFTAYIYCCRLLNYCNHDFWYNNEQMKWLTLTCVWNNCLWSNFWERKDYKNILYFLMAILMSQSFPVDQHSLYTLKNKVFFLAPYRIFHIHWNFPMHKKFLYSEKRLFR